MKTKINPRFAIIILIIIGAASTRFFNFSGTNINFNFTPIGAIALFGGAYFTKSWKAYLIPLIILFVSDILINTLIFKSTFGIMYQGWYWVYASFLGIVVLGKTILKKISVINVVLAGIVASLAHWLLSDFGVWIGGGLDITTGLPYTKDFFGLMKCYMLALPFLKNFFLGTLIYSTIMFGIFELAQRRFTVLSIKKSNI